MMNQRDFSGRLTRWRIELVKFDLKIEHRDGVDHIVPDVLTRGFYEQVEWSTMDINLNAPKFKLKDYVFQDSLPDSKVDGIHVFKRRKFAE